MTADKPSHLVPKLRFAEFVDEPPWECPPLKKLAKRITQRNTHGADLRALTNSAKHGVVDQREYFDRDIATNTDNYYIVETGDYVYNPRISSTAPVGPISKNQIGTGVISPLYTVFRFRSDANDFFAHYFRSSHWHGYLRRVSNRGARHDRMAIKNDDVMQMPIPTPSPREQQKIADCLGSLDDLIAAEGRKLEALRQHKQGLMQQLFPQPGETVPRLRFPEFSEQGEWDETTIGNMGEVITGSTPSTSRRDFYGGDFMFVSPADISDLRFVEKTKTTLTEAGFAECRQIKENSVLFVCIGSTIGKVAQCSRLCATNQQINSLVASSAFVADFAYYLLDNESVRIASLAGKQAVPIIKKSLFAAVKVTAPAIPEQQRIADCLSSLDARLAAQVQKLNALKTHKQGLLQQLFP